MPDAIVTENGVSEPADAEEEDAPETGTGEETENKVSRDNLTTNGGAVISLSSLEYRTESEDAPVVYYISHIISESLMEIYEALGWTPEGNVAVKLSTGEPPASNYLDLELIADLCSL